MDPFDTSTFLVRFFRGPVGPQNEEMESGFSDVVLEGCGFD